jgi:hypothetical protein
MLCAEEEKEEGENIYKEDQTNERGDKKEVA